MLLFFDTETTGVPQNYLAPLTDFANWPRLVQIGWIEYELEEAAWHEIRAEELIVKPDGFEIPDSVSQIHHITTEIARLRGYPLQGVLGDFVERVKVADTIIGHNLLYDLQIIGAELCRCKMTPINQLLEGKTKICTMRASTEFCKLPGGRPYKFPKLNELYSALFHEEMGEAHNALVDIQNTAKCYFELKRLGIIK
jgi:DNA polymerase III epsilon subunit-like protein